eukprot:353615-Chlamydomonas_euryale.AAC.2
MAQRHYRRGGTNTGHSRINGMIVLAVTEDVVHAGVRLGHGRIVSMPGVAAAPRLAGRPLKQPSGK